MGNCLVGIKDQRPVPVLLVLRIFLPGATGKSCRVAVLGNGSSSRMALVKKWIRDNLHGSRLPSLEAIYRLVDAFARNPEQGSNNGIRCFLGGNRFCFSFNRSPVIIMVYAPNKKPTMEEMKPICELIREIHNHNLCHRYAVLLLGNQGDLPAAGAAAQGPRVATGGDSARTRGRPQNLGQRPGAEGRAAVETPEGARRIRTTRNAAGERPDGRDDGKGGPHARPQ